MQLQSNIKENNNFYLLSKVIIIILIIFINKNFDIGKNVIIIEWRSEDINKKILRLIKKLNRFEFKRKPKYIYN